MHASRPTSADLEPIGPYTALPQLVALHRYGPLLRLDGRAPRASQLAGQSRQLQRGRGIDFDEVRPYQPGDDIRAIDWRVTARSNAPHTKLYREERERPVLLAADLRSPMFFGSRRCFKSVYAATLVSTLAWAALARGDRVGGLVQGDRSQCDFRPRRSKHRVLALIRELDAYSRRLDSPCPAEPPRPLAALLGQLIRIGRPGSALFVASDFHDLDDTGRRQLYQLSRHADLTLLQVEDPLEVQAPERPGLWVSDGRRRRPLGQDPGPWRRRQAQRAALERLCGELRVGLYRFSTDQPLLERLLQLYGRERGGR